MSFSSWSSSQYRMKLGWQTWEKYSRFFNNDRIQLWTEPNPWVENDTLIVIADKNQCAQTLKELSQTTDLFHEVPVFKNGLQNHELLIGILLGFGKNNASLYRDHSNLQQIWGSEYRQEAKKLYFKSVPYRIMTPSDILLPGFVGDPETDESKQLKSNYISAKNDLVRFYEGKNFLEATLSLLKYGQVI